MTAVVLLLSEAGVEAVQAVVEGVRAGLAAPAGTDDTVTEEGVSELETTLLPC